MSHWKDTFRILAILVAYGLAGHLDYQDAIAQEEPTRAAFVEPCATAPTPVGHQAPATPTLGVRTSAAAKPPFEPPCPARIR